jgi:hypothetical protein
MSKHIRPPLDALIDAAAKLPPGPDAWAPIFRHYLELSVEDLAQKFRESVARQLDEADQLEHFGESRREADGV